MAQRADVDVTEVLNIELDDSITPSARTVFQLSKTLSLPTETLVEVAGLATPSGKVRDAAVRFAARSEPMATLSPAERDAFDEFVKVLAEASDSGC